MKKKMMKRKLSQRKINTGKLERSFLVKRADIDEENRTVAIAFSSEAPVERWWGTEILSHDSASNVRLGRLNDGGALLVDHDPRDHVGTVESSSVDADSMGRATVRFGRSARAEEIFQDVLDGIRKHISVGYQIHKMEEDRDTDTFTATDWEPFELSFVSIPADASVGVGRSMRSQSDSDIETIILTEEKIMKKRYDAEGNVIDEEGNIIERKAPAPAPTPVVDKEATTTAVENARRKEITRAREIRALGKEHGQEVMAEQAIEDGKSIEEMRVSVLDVLKDTPSIPARPESELGLSNSDTQRFSIMKALNASYTGDWRGAEFEQECSNTISDALGREAQGFFVPFEVQNRTMNVADDTAGGYLVQQQPQDLIEYLYANTVVGNAGATFLNGLVGDVPIPKQTGATSFYWLGEDEDGTDGEPTLGNVILMPKTVAGAVPMTRKLMKQSSPAVEALVMNDLNRGVALALDVAALNGSGVDGEPLGVLNTTGIATSTIASAGSPTWVETVEFESDVDTGNALMGNLSWVMTPAVKGNMKTVSKDAGSGLFIMSDNNVANGYNAQTTTQMPANGILFGDFSSLLIGMWGVMDVMADKATKAASGGLVMRVFQDADVGVRHIESFCKNA